MKTRYAAKTTAELQFIIADAGEAARNMRDLGNAEAECKYLDQVNDAVTELHNREARDRIAASINETRAMLRRLPVSQRGAFHQMASRYVKDAAMFLKRGVLDVAWQKAAVAKFQADRIDSGMAV